MSCVFWSSQGVSYKEKYGAAEDTSAYVDMTILNNSLLNTFDKCGIDLIVCKWTQLSSLQ